MSDTENDLINKNNEDVVDQITYRPIKFPVDFSLLLYFFNFTFTSAVLLNQISYQVCTVILKVNATVCDSLEFSDTIEIKNLEEEIQPYTTRIKMTQQMIENVFPALLSFLIGPWSDTFGRKPLLLSSHAGSVFFYAVASIVTVLARYYEVNPWYYLIGSVGVALSGGVTVNIISMFAYIADTSKEEDREKRMGYLEGALFVGLFLGYISTSYVLKWTNSTYIFAIAAILQTISVLYIAIFVVESRQVPEDAPKGCMKRIRELFKIHLIVDLFKACFKKRERFDRAILWLIICSLVINMFVIEGYSNILYLFTRERFSWNIKDFSLYESLNIAVQCFGLLLVAPLLLKLKIPTLIIVIIAFLSYFVNFLVFGFVKESFMLYIVIIVTFLKPLTSPICRATISKVIHIDDVGKAYSILTSFESLAPIGAAPLFSLAYENTLKSFPNFVMFLAAGIILISTINILFIIIIKRKYYTNGFSYEALSST